jgi:glycosyltransferase involved in cell wall biosynthesis
LVSAPYTVVIPAYKAAGFIGETLSAILAQAMPPQRIIVVDDGSPDDTAGAVRAVAGPIDYVRQDNTGPGAATTRGFALVDTDLVATCDADDLWLPQKAGMQLAALAHDPALAGVFARMADFRGDPASADFSKAYDGWNRSTMFIRTAVAASTGAIIDPRSGAGDMIDWLARVREGGHRLEMLPEVLALRRVHEGSLTYRDRGGLTKAYLEVVRAAMERRRKADTET